MPSAAEPQPNPNPRDKFRNQEAMNHFLVSWLLNFLLAREDSAGQQYKGLDPAGVRFSCADGVP